jgi:Flp pilus assembly protein CpaB
MSGKSTSPLSRLFAGKRAGTMLMVGGAVLAALAFFMVMGIARRSQAAAAQTVKQVYVVTATRDIPQLTAVSADALAIRAFPAAFAPTGVATKIEDVVGKFATTTIVRDQMVLTSQVSTSRRTSNLSASIPPGKVAFWMPLPSLLVQSGGLQAGDKVDILLSLEMTVERASGLFGGEGDDEISSVSTQTTLQNVEVFFAGSANNADLPEGAPAPPAGASGGATATRQSASQVVAFLLDPQDAVTAKWIKDSGGTIDLVLRSDADKDTHATESVNADTAIDGFRFRIPERWDLGK